MGRELFIDLGAPHRTTRLSTDDSGNLLVDGVTIGGGAPSGAAGGDLAGTYPNPTVNPAAASLKTRMQLQMEAQGYFAENFNRQVVDAGSAPTSGSVWYVAIGLRAGDVVTNLNLMCEVLGSGFSGIGVKVGLYTKALARVAQSGDVSASFASAGPKVCPLTGTYTVPTSDGYFAALIVVGSVPPVLARGAASTFASGAFGGAQSAFGFQNAQTDLPATAVITANNNNAVAPWVGVS